MFSEMQVMNSGGGGNFKIYREFGVTRSNALGNLKVTCTDEITGQTFQPRYIQFLSYTNNATRSWMYDYDRDPTKEYITTNADNPASYTIGTRGVMGFASIDADGFTLANVSNYIYRCDICIAIDWDD